MNKRQLAKDTKVAKKEVGKPSSFSKDIIVTKRGQWDYPGQVTRIPSNQITMKNVPYPVFGIDDQGNQQIMLPEQDYLFPGRYVTEYPMVQLGGESYQEMELDDDQIAYYRNLGYRVEEVPTIQKGGSPIVPGLDNISYVEKPNWLDSPYANQTAKVKEGWGKEQAQSQPVFEYGGDVFETEMDDDTIEYYRRLGYRIEEI